MSNSLLVGILAPSPDSWESWPRRYDPGRFTRNAAGMGEAVSKSTAFALSAPSFRLIAMNINLLRLGQWRLEARLKRIAMADRTGARSPYTQRNGTHRQSGHRYCIGQTPDKRRCPIPSQSNQSPAKADSYSESEFPSTARSHQHSLPLKQ